MRARKKTNVPMVLEERLLIDKDDRNLLQAIEELSPRDTGIIYVTPSIFNLQVPTLKMISDKIGKTKGEVWKRLNKIREVWKVPKAENLPTNNGFFDKEDALINALTNQHKLRWDENFGDYRVSKIHIINGEMGTGTLYTNNEAFLGEKIVRQSMGIDEVLNSYHMQGGIMPDLVTMFGKAKNKRALMTGLNKTRKTENGDELELIAQKLELLTRELNKKETPLNEKQIGRLKKWVVNTIDSMEEAAESVAYELKPLVENIPKHSEIHMYFSYNDDYNQSELEDKNIAVLRKIHQKMEKVVKNLPDLRERKESLLEERVKTRIQTTLSNKVYHYLVDIQNDSKEEVLKNGNKFKEYQKSFFETQKGDGKKHLDNLKRKLRKEAEEILDRPFEISDSLFDDEVNSFYDVHTSQKKVEDHRSAVNKKLDGIEGRLSKIENEINEAEAFESSRLVEEMEGHSWFTKKISIKPTEAKALEMIKKGIYMDLYNNILIPKLKELTKSDLNISLHTDSMITIGIRDPQYLIEGREVFDDEPIGTLLTSFPRTNDQRSNEPLKESLVEIIRFHEGEISERVKVGGKKPTKFKEFNKRNFSSSDIYVTSWGADGYREQKKFTIGPTTIKGEFRLNTEIAQYFKVPTRHDTSKLGELLIKGNRGTWAGKRLAKGGCTTGNVIYIEHADQSTESIFIDDDYYKQVAQKYGEEYSKQENNLIEAQSKLEKTKSKKLKSKYKREIFKIKSNLSEIHEEVRPMIYNILLQNDMHLGAYSTPGRPSLVDGIRSSQLIATQSFGLDNLQYSIMTEALNGEQAWRSYDSKREGFWKDPVTFMNELNLLKSNLLKKGADEKEIIEYSELYIKQFLEGMPSFKPEEQKRLFREVLQPINEELMENGMILYLGAGNHWMAKKEAEDEAVVIADMFDSKYARQGRLTRSRECSGQGFVYDMVKLPSKLDDGINAVIAHKMWHGATEISQIPSQGTRTREDAVYFFAGDRHHPGSIAEKGKMGVLDVGKQPIVPYVKMIGKVSSVRGTIIAGYGAKKEKILSARYFLDPVTDKISGWDHRAGILKKCNSLIEEAINDNSIYVEMRKIDKSLERNIDKFNRFEVKYKER